MDDKIKSIMISKLKKYEKLSKILHHLFVEICDISQKKYYIFNFFKIYFFKNLYTIIYIIFPFQFDLWFLS